MDDIVDYAGPLIQAETLLKTVHKACLDREYADAYEAVMKTIMVLRNLEGVLVIMNADEKRKEQWTQKPSS